MIEKEREREREKGTDRGEREREEKRDRKKRFRSPTRGISRIWGEKSASRVQSEIKGDFSRRGVYANAKNKYSHFSISQQRLYYISLSSLAWYTPGVFISKPCESYILIACELDEIVFYIYTFWLPNWILNVICIQLNYHNRREVSSFFDIN